MGLTGHYLIRSHLKSPQYPSLSNSAHPKCPEGHYLDGLSYFILKEHSVSEKMLDFIHSALGFPVFYPIPIACCFIGDLASHHIYLIKRRASLNVEKGRWCE